MAITNEKRPIASARPAPIKAILDNCSPEDGLRAIELSRELKILPTPRAAPSIPKAINPTAMNFSDVASIILAPINKLMLFMFNQNFIYFNKAIINYINKVASVNSPHRLNIRKKVLKKYKLAKLLQKFQSQSGLPSKESAKILRIKLMIL